MIIFCESAELFQNLENVYLLTEKNDQEVKYQKLKQNKITNRVLGQTQKTDGQVLT